MVYAALILDSDAAPDSLVVTPVRGIPLNGTIRWAIKDRSLHLSAIRMLLTASTKHIAAFLLFTTFRFIVGKRSRCVGRLI